MPTYKFKVIETQTVEADYAVEADNENEARELAEIGSTTFDVHHQDTMQVIDREVQELVSVE